MFYRWAKIENNQERATLDVRQMHVLNAALALFSKDGAGVFNTHQQELIEEIRKLNHADISPDNH